MESVVISLKKNTDRRNTLKEKLEFGGITNYQIFDAIEECKEEDLPTPWKKDPRLKNDRKYQSRKCCYMSHLTVLKSLNAPSIILEDDIYFKKQDVIPISLSCLPEDAYMAFWDCTHIEEFDVSWCPVKSGGWVKIDTSNVRVWCAGCYWIKDPQEVYRTLCSRPSKVYDKCLIDYFQKEKPCYVWFAPSCFQDRESYISDIK